MSALGPAALIARRELLVRLRSRAFRISTGLVLAVIVGGTVLAATLGDDDPARVGLEAGASALRADLESAASSLGVDLALTDVAPGSAETAVRDGGVDVVLRPAGDGVEAVVREALGDDVGALVDGVVRERAVDAALAQRGVDPDELAAAVAGAQLEVVALDPPSPDRGQRALLAYVAVLVLYAQLIFFGVTVAQGVTEEKSSRVVEVLLAAVHPLQLLAGKVVGIGAVGLLQLVLFGATGLAAGTATGQLELPSTAVAVLAAIVGFFVLGYLFFAVLYAAAGAMVSRQEEVNTVSAPLTVLIFAMFFVAQPAVLDGTAQPAATLAWVPPFSAVLIPVRVATGDATALQVTVGAVLLLLATAGLAVVAARIYARSVLRTGSRVRLREALRG